MDAQVLLRLFSSDLTPDLAFRDGVGDLCMMVPGVHGPCNRDLHSRSVASAGCSG